MTGRFTIERRDGALEYTMPVAVSLAPLAKMQFNQGGIPLAGGLLFTYAAGTASTPLATYTDSTGVTPNANPIILDANGQCDLWLKDGYAYKLVLSPSTDTNPPTNPYWTEDNVSNNIIPFAPTFGSITVVGTSTLGGAVTMGSTLAVTGNTTIGGTLGVTGNTTVGGTLGVTGNATFSGTINKITLTQPATGATLTLIDGKTLTSSNTLTLTGTDGITVAFGGGLSIASGKVLTASNTLTMTATDGSTAAFGVGGTVAYKGLSLAQFAATTSAELAGIISNETGTGLLVFATDPTFTLTDVTTNNVTSSQHGWCPKLSNVSTQFLNGTGSFSTPAATVPGWNLLSTVTASSSATVDIETTFDSTYDNYAIVVNALRPQTSATAIYAYLKIAGSYVVSAYKSHMSNTKSSSTAYSSITSTTTEIILTSADVDNTTNGVVDFICFISNPTDTNQYRPLRCQGGYANNSNVTTNINGSGATTVTGALTGVRFAMSSGNIFSGKFRLYGIRNS